MQTPPRLEYAQRTLRGYTACRLLFIVSFFYKITETQMQLKNQQNILIYNVLIINEKINRGMGFAFDIAYPMLTKLIAALNSIRI